MNFPVSNRTHNLWVAPIVLLIRVPLLTPLWLLARLGEAAEGAGDALGKKLPGFRR